MYYIVKVLENIWKKIESQDRAVSITTGYGLDNQGVGVRVPVGARIFTSPYCTDRLWGPSSFPSNVYRRTLSPGLKRPVHEADNSPIIIAEVKKTWVYTPTPPYFFMA
jgi:hypothetical protein